MTITVNELSLQAINAALLRIQRSIQTGNNNFQNDVEKAVANVTISGKTTIQRYDDSRLMAIVNELNQRYENLTREQSDLRTKIVNLETILSNVSLGYDPSSNTISYTLGDYSTDVQLKDTTYTFSYDTDTGTFTIVDEYTGETVLNQVFNDTTYTFSFDNGILTVHNNRLNTDQTFNFDSRYYTEAEIQSLILDKIPSEASSSNQLADKAFVNSSIATATATFRGTVTTTQALEALTGDLNDYAYLQNIDPTTGQTTSYDRYKWVESGGDYGHWKYEYTLNNSSFTADQWAAINSGITCQIVTDLLDGCYTGHGSALCKSNGNEWRNLLATNCDCADAVYADYIYYNTSVRVNQCSGLLSANRYCVLGRGYLPYAMCNLTASSLGLIAGCCYPMTCILDMLRCCYGSNPGTYVFQFSNAQNPIVCETSGYAYCLSFTKLDSVNVAAACWQKDHWVIEDNTTGQRWTASACSATTVGSWDWVLNRNLTACKIYRNPTCSDANLPLFLAGNNTAGYGYANVSGCCQATFNPSTGLLSADCFNGAIDETKYPGACCTGTLVPSDLNDYQKKNIPTAITINNTPNLTCVDTILSCFNSTIQKSAKRKTFSSAHCRYIYLANIAVSTGSVSSTSFDLYVFSNMYDACSTKAYTVGTIHLEISSGSNANGFTIRGYTDIRLDCTTTAYPRIIVTKDTTTSLYCLYLDSSYAYLSFDIQRNKHFGTGAWGDLCARASLSGTEIFNSSTSPDEIKYIGGLISDIALDVYCDTTCICTLDKSSSLCLAANAFNEYAQISTTTYPGACCEGTVTDGSFNGTVGTVSNGCLSFSNINFDNICNSTSKGVAANNITRRYLITNQITSVGYITRWGLGLERGTTGWGTGLLSLGVKDDGTCFADYKFTHTGGISLTCCGCARCITLYGCATKNVFTCCLGSASNTTKYVQIKTKANRSSCSVSFDFDFFSMNGTINLDNGNNNQYYAGGYYGNLCVSVCSYTCTCCDCFWLTYTGYRTLTLKSVYDFEVICNTTTAPEGVTFCRFVKRPSSVTKVEVSDDASYNVLLSKTANDSAMPSIGSNDKLTFNPSTGILNVSCGACIGWNRTKSTCVKVTPTAQSSCWIYIGRFQPNGTADTTNNYNELNLTIAAVGSGMVSSANIKVLTASAVAPTVIVQRQYGYITTTGIDCIAVTRSGSTWNCYVCVWARVISNGTCPYYLHLYRNMLPDSWGTSLTVCSAITGTIVGVGNVGAGTRAIQSNVNLRIGSLTACTSSIAGCDGSVYSCGFMEMYATTPFIDFHVNNYCGDYSHRILACDCALCFRATNGTGCTSNTQGATFQMCATGLLYSDKGFVAGCVNALCSFISINCGCDQRMISMTHNVGNDIGLLIAHNADWDGSTYCNIGVKIGSGNVNRGFYHCKAGTAEWLQYWDDACEKHTCPQCFACAIYGCSSATFDGTITSCNTLRRSSVYSSNTYGSGWYLVAQLSSKENASGNHDITLGGYIDMTCGANVNLRRFCFKTSMRGNKCTVSSNYAFLEPYGASDFLRVTRDVNTTDCTFTLRVYAKVCGNYTRMNTTIDYYGGGDVNASRGLNSSAITFPNTYVADEASMTGTQITLNCGVGTLRANDIHVGYVQCASCRYVRIRCDETSGRYIQINGPNGTDKGFILTTNNCICGCCSIGMEIGSGNVNRGLYHIKADGNFQWLQYWDASNEIHNCPAKFVCSVCAGGNITTPSGVYSAWYYTCPTSKTCSFAANSKTYFLLGCFQPTNSIYANNLELGFSLGGSNLVGKGSLKALLTSACRFSNNNITVDYSNYENTKYGVNAVGFTSSGDLWSCCIGVWLEICNPSSSACSWNVSLYRNLLSCIWSTCMTCTTTAPTFVCCIPVTCNRRNTHFNNSDVTLCRLTTTEKCTAPIMLTCSIPTVSSAYFLLGCYNVLTNDGKCRNELNLAFNVNQGMNLNTVGSLNLLLSNEGAIAELFSTNIIDLCVSEPWGNGTRRVKSVGFTSDNGCLGVWVEVYNGYDSARDFDVSLLPNLVAAGWTSCLCCQNTAPTFLCCIPVPTGDKMPFHYSNAGGSSSWKSVYCGCNTITPQCQYFIMKAGPINASTVGKLDFLLCTSVDGTDYPSKICGTLMPGNAGTDAYNPDLIKASFTSTRCALYPLSIGLDSTCCLVFAFAYQCGCTFRPQLFFKNDQFNEALGTISTSFLCCDSDPTTYRTYVMANMSCQCDSGMFITSVNANQVTANCLSTYSKRSLKKDITPYMGCALNLIGNTNVVSYRYKTESENSLVHIGFIADDTPELLSGENKDTMRINDSVGLLLKAVQELDERTLPFWKKITNIVRKLIRRFRNGKKD